MTTSTEQNVRQPSEASATPPTSRARAALVWITPYGLIIMFAAVVIFFAVYGKTSSTYLAHANIIALVGNQAVVLIVALAVLVPLAAGYIDLSIGAITGVASLVSAALMSKAGVGVPVALIAGILSGVALGAVNATFVAVFGLSSIITTLGMSTALSGFMLLYTKGETISNNIPQSITNFGALNWLGIPRVTFVMIPVVLVCWFLLENTPFGRYLQSIASNRRSAQLVGIPVTRAAFTGFMFAGLLAGIAGVLLTARAGSADATTGPSYLFPALAAVFLGATTIHPGRPNVWGTAIAIFFVAFVVSGLSLLGASTWAPDVFNGLILIVAATLATLFARQRGGGWRIF